MESRLKRYFAYEQPRPKQMELASKVYEALVNGNHLILQAPTGFGKTAGVLAGILPFLEETEARVHYVVRTHREAEVVIRELDRIVQDVTFPFRVMEIRGKRHLCNVTLERAVQADVIDKYCRKLVEENRCRFYLALRSKLSETKKLANQNVLSSQYAFRTGIAKGFCPYYFLKRYLASSDLIVMPYQYVIIDHLRRDVVRTDRKRMNLVIDECVGANTLILTAEGQIEANKFFLNNVPSVMSILLDDLGVQSKVKNIVASKRREFSKDVINIRTDEGRALKLTGRTQVLQVKETIAVWGPAAGLSKGDKIMTFEGGSLAQEKIVEMTKLPSQDVYDFVSFPDHNYVANGMIVHNSHNMPFVIASDRSWKLRVIDIEEALLEVYSLDAAARSIMVRLLQFLKENKKDQAFVLNPSEFISQMEKKLGDVPFNQILQILDNSAKLVQESIFSSEAIIKSSLAYVAEFLQEVYRSRLSESFFLQYVPIEPFPRCYLELSCFDSSSVGQRIFRNFNSVIHVSGTNEWEEAYAALTGVPAQYTKYVIDPSYDEANIFLGILENMSSRETDRTEEKYALFSHTLAELVNMIIGKSVLYFPSFEVLSSFREIGFENLVEKEMFWENDNMNTNQHQEMINQFVDDANGECLLAGVMGGRSGEGVDFGPGIVRSAIVFGVPFPEPSPKMEKYVEYLNTKFQGKGELYGYSYPAVIKAAQALGRAFRSPEDKVVLILADDRYFSYGLFDRFPNWIKRSLKGRYRDHGPLLRDLAKVFDYGEK